MTKGSQEPEGSVVRRAAPLSPRSSSARSPSRILFPLYSPKAGRRLQLYLPQRYTLWIRVELDRTIRKFNEYPKKIPLSLGPGLAAEFAPGMVTLGQTDDDVGIHTFSGVVDDEEEGDPVAIQEVDRALGWDPNRIESEDSIRQRVQTRAKLISTGMGEVVRGAARFDITTGSPTNCVAQVAPGESGTTAAVHDPARLRPYRQDLANLLMSELQTERRMTVWALAQRFVVDDPEEVMTEIAGLILYGSDVYSDIGTVPFDYATELSAFGPPREQGGS